MQKATKTDNGHYSAFCTLMFLHSDFAFRFARNHRSGTYYGR